MNPLLNLVILLAIFAASIGVTIWLLVMVIKMVRGRQ